MKQGNVPTADKILRILADLYADQCGVKVEVHTEQGEQKEETP